MTNEIGYEVIRELDELTELLRSDEGKYAVASDGMIRYFDSEVDALMFYIKLLQAERVLAEAANEVVADARVFLCGFEWNPSFRLTRADLAEAILERYEALDTYKDAMVELWGDQWGPIERRAKDCWEVAALKKIIAQEGQ